MKSACMVVVATVAVLGAVSIGSATGLAADGSGTAALRAALQQAPEGLGEREATTVGAACTAACQTDYQRCEKSDMRVAKCFKAYHACSEGCRGEPSARAADLTVADRDCIDCDAFHFADDEGDGGDGDEDPSPELPIAPEENVLDDGGCALVPGTLPSSARGVMGCCWVLAGLLVARRRVSCSGRSKRRAA